MLLTESVLGLEEVSKGSIRDMSLRRVHYFRWHTVLAWNRVLVVEVLKSNASRYCLILDIFWYK